MEGLANGQAAASPPSPQTEGKADIPKPVKAVHAETRLPAESKDGVWLRRNVLLSFWAVVLLIGLPFWWKTTTVYRAHLPYRAMDSWADGSVSSIC